MFEESVTRFVERELQDSSDEAPTDVDRLLAEIRDAARRSSRADVLRYTRAQDPLVQEGNDRLWAIYEALAPDAGQWEELFRTEVERVLGICSSGVDSKLPFHLLDAFGFLDKSAPVSLEAEITRMLVAALGSSQVRVRRAAAYVIGDVRQSLDRDARQALLAALADPDWRVRALAERTLADFDAVPIGHRPSFADRVRRRFLDWTHPTAIT